MYYLSQFFFHGHSLELGAMDKFMSRASNGRHTGFRINVVIILCPALRPATCFCRSFSAPPETLGYLWRPGEVGMMDFKECLPSVHLLRIPSSLSTRLA